MVRLPDGMRERIKGAAERNGRSMNAEMVQRLEQSFEVDVPDSDLLISVGTDSMTTAQIRKLVSIAFEKAIIDILKNRSKD